MDCDDQPDVSLKDDVGPLSAIEDAQDSKDVNGGAEHGDKDISSPPLSTSMENSKSVGISEAQIIQEQGENCILKALREAFEAVGSPHLPEDKFSFSEAGNPVMALVSWLLFEIKW